MSIISLFILLKMNHYSFDFISQAHKQSSKHKDQINHSQICGCFYCQETFTPNQIHFWIKENGAVETAVCPLCGIDAVLGDRYPVEDTLFLKEMHDYYF